MRRFPWGWGIRESNTDSISDKVGLDNTSNMTKAITITMIITAIMTTTITMTVSLFPAVLRRLTWEGRAQALSLPRCCRRGVPSCQYLLRPCAAHLNAKFCLARGIVRRRLTLYRARAFFVLVVLTRGVSWIFARSPQGFMPGGSQAPDLGGIIGAMVGLLPLKRSGSLRATDPSHL